MSILRKIKRHYSLATMDGEADGASRVSCSKLAAILLESKLLPEELASKTPEELTKELRDAMKG